MTVSSEDIKNLRNVTGAGFLDCKKALEENQNDIKKSISFLRKKGLAKAEKKSTREVKEGAIGLYQNDEISVMIEINTETDFASKNDTFLDFFDQIGDFALRVKDYENSNVDKFLSESFNDKKISDYFIDIISQIGENIVLKRIKYFKLEKDCKLYSYIHNPYKVNIGKICVMLKANVKNINDETNQFGKNLCMHIAASKPLANDIEDLDKSIIENEKDVQLSLIKSSGKPEKIINKILDGKMNKYFSEVTFLNQPYIMDQDKKIKNVLEEFNAKDHFEVTKYDYFVLGS